MENGFFQYSQSWIFQGLFPKILSPNPHPKCLKRSCEVGVPLEWARTKASRFGRFYQTCLVRLGHYTFPSLSVLVPTERARRPLSNHRAQFSNILCQQGSEPITMALSTGVIEPEEDPPDPVEDEDEPLIITDPVEKILQDEWDMCENFK